MTFVRPRLLAALLAVAALVAGCGSETVEPTDAPASAGPAALVPADAAAYVGVVTDADSAEWQAVEELLGRFPDGKQLLSKVAVAISREGVDWDEDVAPALGPLTAIVLPRGGTQAVVLTKPSLRAKLDALLHRADRPYATAQLDDGWVAISARRATLDAYEHALDGPRLSGDDEFNDAVDGLPDGGLATLFARPGGLDVHGFAGASTTDAFDWVSASIAARDDGVAIDGEMRLDDEPDAFEPTLLRGVPAGAVLAVSFDGAADAFDKLAESPGMPLPLPPIEEVLGVKLEEILGLLEGQGVVYVRPGLPIPEVTLAVETNDESKAVETVDRIARKLAGDVQVSESGGVEVHSIRHDRVQISWAADDGLLLVSSGRHALEDFRSDDPKLVDEPAFGRAAAKVDLGDQTSGFVYVDMHRASELIDGIADLADADVPPELARNLEPIESLAVNADGSRFHAFLTIPAR